jgi:hypothetical protein
MIKFVIFRPIFGSREYYVKTLPIKCHPSKVQWTNDLKKAHFFDSYGEARICNRELKRYRHTKVGRARFLVPIWDGEQT